MTIERSEVRVKPNCYQQRKAKMEAVLTPPRKTGGTPYTVNEAIRTLRA